MQSATTLKTLARSSLQLAGVFVAALSGEALAGGAGDRTGPKELGLWIDDTGKGAVRIEICGGKLCGRIAWLKEPLNAEGQPRTDKYNPDPASRDRLICGLPILGQLAQLPEGGFDGGWVYDPKVGKSYDVAISLNGPNQLHVTGYKGVRFLGKTFVWTRSQTELTPCDAQPAAIAPAPTGNKKTAPANTASDLPWAKKPAATASGAKPAAAKPAATSKALQGEAQLGAPKPSPVQKPKPALTSP